MLAFTGGLLQHMQNPRVGFEDGVGDRDPPPCPKPLR